MEKENLTTQITLEDLLFIKELLSKEKDPMVFSELAKKLAYHKNSNQLNQEVKVYDQYCKYDIGDLIFKTYDEPLPVSSKGTEDFKSDIVLEVINKISYESFQCEMLEVGFSGGGTFRKHIDYMKKTNTQVLLPSNQDNKALKPKVLKKEDDPRLIELPMTDKDLRTLEKNLVNGLVKSADFFNWNDFWQLTSKQIKVTDKNLDSIQSQLEKTGKSASTNEIISRIFTIKKTDKLFAIHRLSLNSILESHKKRFVFVSPEEGGRWHLKDIIDSRIKGLPLAAKKAKVPIFEDGKKLEGKQTVEYPLKLYLSWRDVISGGLTFPKCISKEISNIREFLFRDGDTGREFTLFYYPSSHVFVGLKEFYEEYNVSQGASLTIKRTGPTEFSFSLKKSKKKIEVPKVTYNSDKDEFLVDEEDTFSYCLPNKIIFLEKEILKQLFAFYKERKKLDLRDLLILVFQNFGLEGEELFLHYLRAYHLVDLLRMTSQEDIELTLLNSEEFKLSDKKGVYFYREE
ncbi:hypothetical protein ACFLT9_14380, partial [Acidobacteriota bacterium]